jgi:Tfp pilus assembly protein PilF
MPANTDVLENMLARGKDSAMLRLTLAQAYQREQDHGRAILHLERALEQDPHYSAAWKLLGQVQLAQGQPDLARATWERGLDVARERRDMQVVRELEVFLKKLAKQQGGPAR